MLGSVMPPKVCILLVPRVSPLCPPSGQDARTLLWRFYCPQFFPSSKDEQLCCLLPGLLLQLLLLMAGVVNSNDRGHVIIVPICP